jgi:hypothetical protein
LGYGAGAVPRRPSLLAPALALIWTLYPDSTRAAGLLERPRFQVAVGMGASLDRNAPNPNPDRPIASFFFTGGLGAGLLGLDFRAFANGATKVQVTRLALELVGVVRPLAPIGGEGYGFRVLRSLSADLGAALERVSLDVKSDWRRGLVLGGHGDLPIGPAGPKELRLRLGARRMLGNRGTVASIEVADSALELYGQLAFVF